MLKYPKFCLIFLILFSLNKTHSATCDFFVNPNFEGTSSASPPHPDLVKPTGVATNDPKACKISCFKQLISLNSSNEKLAVYCKHTDDNGLTKQKWIRFNYKTAIPQLEL